MEAIRRFTINKTWKICTIAGLFGLFLFITNNIPQILTVQAPSNITVSEKNESAASQPSFTDAFMLQSFDPPSFDDKKRAPTPTPGPAPGPTPGGAEKEMKMKMKMKKCRIYEGKWVFKPTENPRYHVSQCDFLEEKMSCRRNGRPDSDYESWGWKSHGCHLPLFNATDMLERLRRKRMIMVGDSLARNQWESLACLLYTSISPRRAYVDSSNPAYKLFKAKDYKFTLEYYWAPFLVDLDLHHKSGRRVLSLDKMALSSKKWRGADVMVFNSGHWWNHHCNIKSWNIYEYRGKHVEEMQTEVAYEYGMSTWAQWVAQNVNPTKTKVYFRSISPEHSGKQWCFNHSRPMKEDEPYHQYYPREMINIAEKKIREMNDQDGIGKTNVRYLNITGLSSYRIDAHSSIYKLKHGKMSDLKDKKLLKLGSDCTHWCLPGLPDTWNQILYASLSFDHLIPGDLSTS